MCFLLHLGLIGLFFFLSLFSILAVLSSHPVAPLSGIFDISSVFCRGDLSYGNMWLPLGAFVVFQSAKRRAEGAGGVGDTCRHIPRNLRCMWPQPFSQKVSRHRWRKMRFWASGPVFRRSDGIKPSPLGVFLLVDDFFLAFMKKVQMLSRFTDESGQQSVAAAE